MMTEKETVQISPALYKKLAKCFSEELPLYVSDLGSCWKVDDHMLACVLQNAGILVESEQDKNARELALRKEKLHEAWDLFQDADGVAGVALTDDDLLIRYLAEHFEVKLKDARIEVGL